MNRIIKIIIPGFVKQILHKLIKAGSIKKRTLCEKQIPKIPLQKKHMQDCQLLLNRKELIDKLPKFGTVAEIGVAIGNLTEYILKTSTPSKLHLIDVWEGVRYRSDYDYVKQRFNAQINSGSIEIHKKLSIKAAEDFDDKYFDWIYIDTDHSYKSTKNELLKYESKVKKNGIIVGHDYVQGDWVRCCRYGVIEAVHEFCVTRNWKLLYLTAESTENQSFAIKRLSDEQ